MLPPRLVTRAAQPALRRADNRAEGAQAPGGTYLPGSMASDPMRTAEARGEGQGSTGLELRASVLPSPSMSCKNCLLGPCSPDRAEDRNTKSPEVKRATLKITRRTPKAMPVSPCGHGILGSRPLLNFRVTPSLSSWLWPLAGETGEYLARCVGDIILAFS